MNRRENKQLKRMEEAMAGVESKTKNLNWVSKDLVGNAIVGFHNQKPLFEIKRGTLVYTLYILDEKVKERNKLKFSTSTQLSRVKNKADKICQEHHIPYLKPKK